MGLGGSDKLDGKGGDDDLIGNAQSDLFVPAKGYDEDHIKKFEDGLDLLNIDGVVSQQTFDALKITQGVNEVTINLGNGDRLIIEGINKSDLDWPTDFV